MVAKSFYMQISRTRHACMASHFVRSVAHLLRCTAPRALNSAKAPSQPRLACSRAPDHQHAGAIGLRTSMEDEVLTQVNGHLGVITLNRPKALNALNHNMVTRLFDIYQEWDPPTSAVSCIVLQGAGGRALCAGGDVKSVVLSGIAGDAQPGIDFFRAEYRTDYAISQLQKPHIAVLDGIVMGGGAGISMNGDFRVATENTLFAMPECGIGLFPDVGASHFLQKLPGALAFYLALTGARLKGSAVKEAGLATHYVNSAQLPGMMQQLQQLGSKAADFSVVDEVLRGAEAAGGPVPQGGLLPRLPVINARFGSQHSVEQIAEGLRESQVEAEFCQEALLQLLKGSPLSAKVTFELLRRSRALGIAACLHLDFQLAVRFTRGEGDFYEGVRATLIDRGSTPTWRYGTLEAVPQEVVEGFFQPLEGVPALELPVLLGQGAAVTSSRL